MVKLVDTSDSKSDASDGVPVQVRPPVPFQTSTRTTVSVSPEVVLPVALDQMQSQARLAIIANRCVANAVDLSVKVLETVTTA